MRRQALLPWRNAGAGEPVAPAADEIGLVWRVRLMLWIKQHGKALKEKAAKPPASADKTAIEKAIEDLEAGRAIQKQFSKIKEVLGSDLDFLSETTSVWRPSAFVEVLNAFGANSLSTVNPSFWTCWTTEKATFFLPTDVPDTDIETLTASSTELERWVAWSGRTDPGRPVGRHLEPALSYMWCGVLGLVHELWCTSGKLPGEVRCHPECRTNLEIGETPPTSFGKMDCCMFRREEAGVHLDLVVEFKPQEADMSQALAQALAAAVAVKANPAPSVQNDWVVLVGLTWTSATIARVSLGEHCPIQEHKAIHLHCETERFGFLCMLLAALRGEVSASPVVATDPAMPNLWALESLELNPASTVFWSIPAPEDGTILVSCGNDEPGSSTWPTTADHVKFECDQWFAKVTHAPPIPTWAASCEQVTFHVMCQSTTQQLCINVAERIQDLITHFPKARLEFTKEKKGWLPEAMNEFLAGLDRDIVVFQALTKNYTDQWESIGDPRLKVFGKRSSEKSG
jgi:hypothetical protein